MYAIVLDDFKSFADLSALALIVTEIVPVAATVVVTETLTFALVAPAAIASEAVTERSSAKDSVEGVIVTYSPRLAFASMSPANESFVGVAVITASILSPAVTDTDSAVIWSDGVLSSSPSSSEQEVANSPPPYT